MDELKELIITYRKKNSSSDDDLAKILLITPEMLSNIESGNAEIDNSEVERMCNILKQKNKESSRKAIKIMDLIFRFGATIMALVVIILSIYGYSNTKALIALLAVGVACISMTTLPKIDK